MMLFHRDSGLVVCLCLLATTLVGCQPAKEVPLSNEAGSQTVDTPANVDEGPDSDPVVEAPAAIEEKTVESAPMKEAAPAKSQSPIPSTSAPSKVGEKKPVQPGAPLPTQVTLGVDEELCAGIPGEGQLSMDQIAAWLDTPGVHETLEVSLPLGLSLGQQQITGLDENPMTRAKIELGRQLYFDGRLSSDGTISCASCHHPDTGWTAQTQFGVGVDKQEGNRNSPVSFNRILSGPQFWDGRAASLEEQAVGPIANPIEMANTHEVAVATVGMIEGYRVQFERVFGKDSVNIDNIGKAMATFERAIVTGPSPYDYRAALKPFVENFEADDLAELKEDDPELHAKYEKLKAGADAHPMSESAIRGQELFFSEKVGCTQCHVGANFADEKYHNLGVGMDVKEPDLGRFVVTKDEKDKGAFKTPTVRNVAFTGPFMHDGSQKTLEEVVEWYAKGGHPNKWLSPKVKKFEMTDQDKQDIVAFMKALNGPFTKVEPGRLPK